jgi:oligopeptide transport system substrate-binding protein
MDGLQRGLVRACVGGAGVAALLLAACASQDSPQLAPAGPVPERGGTFRLALEPAQTLDPALTDDAYEATVANQVFSGLVQWDSDLNVLPDVAQSWTVSSDGREYRFELRNNARFHNGRQLVAEDFVYSFTRLLDPRQVPRGIIQDYLTRIEGVEDFNSGRAATIRGLEAPDPFTLVIRLARPYSSFLSVLGMDQAKVVPREEIERLGSEEFGRHPVGTGPFRLAEWNPATRTVLVASRDYFGTPAYLDSVILDHAISEQPALVQSAFLSGTLDGLQVRENELSTLLRRREYPIVRRLELSLEFMGFSVTTPPFDDARVRRAVAMAVDRDDLAGAVGLGFDVPTGLLPPGIQGFSPDSKILPEDLDEARRLLAEAGYGPGRPLRFPLLTASRTRHAAVRDSVLVNSLRRVHIFPELRNVSWLELNEAVNSREAAAFELSWIADIPDPDSFLYTLLDTHGYYNIFSYSNAHVDSLLEAGGDEVNQAKRLLLYREAERVVLAEVPLVPLLNVMTLYAFQPLVRGVEMAPFGICSVPMEKIWFDRRHREGMYAGL